MKKPKQTKCNAAKPADKLSTLDQVPSGKIYHPCHDHDYCRSSTATPSLSPIVNDEDVTSNSNEATNAKSIPSGKVLKWQDYLQRMRLGVRSAPNSPSTSPKIPRGAARKVNNFMVGEVGENNAKFKTAAQPQTVKPTLPLVDPLTAVKSMAKKKAPAIELQEFKDYLAHLEYQEQEPSVKCDISPPTNLTPPSNDGSWNLAPVEVTIGDSPSKPHTGVRTTEAVDKPVSETNSSNSVVCKVKSCLSAPGKHRPKKPAALSANDPRRKAWVRAQQSALTKSIPPVKWISSDAESKGKSTEKRPETYGTGKPTVSPVSLGKNTPNNLVNEVPGQWQKLLSSVSALQKKVNLIVLRL